MWFLVSCGAGTGTIATVPAADLDKRVSWAELFFDLVFVLAITQVSALLEHDHSAAGLLRALVAFVPVYWVWVGTAVQANLRDTEPVRMQIGIFAIALAAVFLAITLPGAYDTLGVPFAVAYWVARVVLLVLNVRQPGRPSVNPYVVSVCLTGPALLVGALVAGDARLWWWTAAAIIDLSTPTVLRRRMARMHFNASHLAERFGLFVLIALGESVVAIGASAHVERGLDAATTLAVVVSFVFATALWWTYFHFSADAVRHALATASVQLDITRFVLSYGHLLFITGVVLVAGGLHGVVAEPTQRTSAATTGLLVGGTALFLACFGLTRWAMFRLVSRTRLTAAAVVLAMWPVALHVPAAAAVGVLAAVLVALNGYELLSNERIGWRAKTQTRTG